MKIVMLGGTKEGKTYVLASMGQIAIYVTSNGMRILPKNPFSDAELKAIWKETSDQLVGTFSVREYELQLSQEGELKSDLFITDIMGEVNQMFSGKPEVEIVLKKIREADAVVIVIAPPGTNYGTTEEQIIHAKKSLTMASQFAKEIQKNSKKNIPIALLLSKIDKLEKNGEIGSLIDDLKSNLSETYNKEVLIDEAMADKHYNTGEKTLGEKINDLIKPIALNRNIKDLIRDFYYTFGKEKSLRVFLCSSLGFGKKKDEEKMLLKKPFGVAACFYWLLLTHLKLKTSATSHTGIEISNNETALLDALTEAIQEIHKKGEAYYDETDNSVYNLRSITSPNYWPNL